MDSTPPSGPGALQQAEFLANLYHHASPLDTLLCVTQSMSAPQHLLTIPASPDTPGVATHGIPSVVPSNFPKNWSTLGWLQATSGQYAPPPVSQAVSGQQHQHQHQHQAQYLLYISSAVSAADPNVASLPALSWSSSSPASTSGRASVESVTNVNIFNAVPRSPKPLSIRCELCLKHFTRPSSLKAHMLTHTGEKPHRCLYLRCNKRYTTKYNLRRHMRTHCCAPDAAVPNIDAQQYNIVGRLYI